MICKSCGKDKPETEFHWRRATGRLRTYCKKCGRSSINRTAHKIRRVCLEHYSGGKMVCDCCGENHYEFLTLDHINGNGRKHRKEVGKGYRFLRWLVSNKFPDGIRVLCYNCNCSRGRYGICPHELERTEKNALDRSDAQVGTGNFALGEQERS